MSIIRDVKIGLKSGNSVLLLILANITVFLFVNLLLALAFRLYGDIDSYYSLMEKLMLPSLLSELIYQPYSVITHEFLHADIWHLAGNMLIFYWMGNIFSDLTGDKKITPLYLYGGLTGALFYVLSYNLFPQLGLGMHALGASASVSAVVMATAVLAPDYKVRMLFVGYVSIKYVALFFIVSDLVIVSTSIQPGGSIAHLGGVLFGWLFTYSLRRGFDMSKGFNRAVDGIKNFFDNKPQPKVRVTYRRPNNMNADFNSLSNTERQRRIDEILDKISKSGYDSLSKEEKEILFKASKD